MDWQSYLVPSFSDSIMIHKALSYFHRDSNAEATDAQTWKSLLNQRDLEDSGGSVLIQQEKNMLL